MARPVFNTEKCKACEMCVSVCPKKIISLSPAFNSRGYNPAQCSDDSACIGCMMCARMCPDTVIEIYK